MGTLRRWLGRRVRELRLQNRLTLEQLAGESGLDAKYLGEFERGNENISVDSLEKVAKALGMTVADFFQPAPKRHTPSADRFARRALALIQKAKFPKKRMMVRLLEVASEPDS